MRCLTRRHHEDTRKTGRPRGTASPQQPSVLSLTTRDRLGLTHTAATHERPFHSECHPGQGRYHTYRLGESVALGREIPLRPEGITHG